MNKKEVFIGIDLAWGEKNLSGFCVLTPEDDKLKIIDIKLLKSIDEMVEEIKKYSDHKVYVGVDAPLVITNEENNRTIEKEFNKDFSKYKISMLPVNRKIMTKYSPTIRSEVLYTKLNELGFKRDYESSKVIFEIYTHSTISVCFNEYKILPYKRKKGRNTEFIKEHLAVYKKYLLSVVHEHIFFDTELKLLKGSKLKDYEDILDAITCAYAMHFCKNNKCKFYKVDGIDTLVTPI